MVKGGAFSAFVGTFPRIVSHGTLTIPPRILFGTKKMPKRWYASAENQKVSLFTRPSGNRQLVVVSALSRGRVSLKALLILATMPISGEVLIRGSRHGDFIVIQKI